MSLFGEYPMMRVVPDFVGLAYDDAVALERRLGLHLADPNPDAAPISNYWWEHKDLVVLTQSPAAGSRIDRQQSVTITLVSPQAPVGARVSAPPPPVLSAAAEGDAENGVEAPGRPDSGWGLIA